jgi:putative ABC transport system permease protein
MRMTISALDFKLGFRMLRRYPGLSVIGGLALSVAIAVGVLTFELVNDQLNPSLPLDEGDRIVRIENFDRAAGALEPHGLYDFQMWRSELRSIEQLGAARSTERNLSLPGVPARPIPIAEMTPSAFTLTRVPPLLGRPLIESDALPGAPDVVVIREDLWRRRLGGDPSIIGRTLQLGGTRATVVGVMPESFGFPRFQQAWLPLRETASAPGEGPPVLVCGRLARGATLGTALAEVATVSPRLAAADSAYRKHLQPRVVPFAALVPPVATPVFLLVIFTGVFAVMAGISANVATLMFARTALRETEIVVRTALGATRRRVVEQLLVETLVLSGAATLVGMLIARGILQLVWYQQTVVREVPQPFWRDASLNPATVLWGVGLGLVGTALVGLLPAIKATQSQVRDALARSQAGASGMRFGGVWTFVIVAQVAFSVLGLSIAVGATRESLRDRGMRPAFASRDYLTFQVQYDEAARGQGQREAGGTRLEAALREMERRLLADPSISAVTIASSLPGTGASMRRLEARRDLEAPFLVHGNFEELVASSGVDLDFFDVFELPMVAGRAFDSADRGARTVVVNESLAKNLGGNPIGMQVRYPAERGDGGIDEGEPGPWQEVVGVVTNTGMNPTDRGDGDFVYHAALPSELNPGYFAARVRGTGSNLGARIPSIAAEVDPVLRVYDVFRLDELRRRRNLTGRMIGIGAMVIVSLAVLLSAAGLFALVAVAVEGRRREIGIRMALGASTRGVLQAVFARTAAQLGAGILVGNGLLLGLRLLQGGGTVKMSAVVLPLAAVSALMALVGIAACVVPARRALRVQPTEAIRGVEHTS